MADQIIDEELKKNKIAKKYYFRKILIKKIILSLDDSIRHDANFC